MTKPRAVVLLSGGLDSATAAAMMKARGFDLYALSFRYGQRHALELEAARRVATQLGVSRHVTVEIDLRAFGGSALTADLEVPKDRSAESIGTGVPITYVPARNTIFLAFGLAWAETLGISDIVIGVNALDYSGYPDCRPEYIAAFQQLANLGTRAGTELGQRFAIHTPLILLSKREIIERGVALGVDYGLTLSCYDPSAAGKACGRCDACQLRLKGFRENGLEDPARYQEEKSVNGER
jgi:7-cyano-7-deazaguanine synthase